LAHRSDGTLWRQNGFSNDENCPIIRDLRRLIQASAWVASQTASSVGARIGDGCGSLIRGAIYSVAIDLYLACVIARHPRETTMKPREMSGLELLRAAADGRIPPASMAATIPTSLVQIDPGYVKMRARADGRHLNPMGGVHGGFAASVLDSVTGCAVHTMLEAGVGYGTIDLHVKMLRPVPCDQDLVGEARAVHVSRNIATSEGTLKTPDGKLLATATATCFLKRGQDRGDKAPGGA